MRQVPISRPPSKILPASRLETSAQRTQPRPRLDIPEPQPTPEIPEDTTPQNEGKEDTPNSPPQRLGSDTTTPRAAKENPSQETQAPPITPSPTNMQTSDNNLIPELQPNYVNFPQLSSPGPNLVNHTPQSSNSPQPGTPQSFVWRRKTDSQPPDKGKSKTPAESAPLTKQYTAPDVLRTTSGTSSTYQVHLTLREGN